MKDRINHLPTTLPSLLILAFLALCVWLKPELIDEPSSLFVIGAGILGLFYKPSPGSNPQQ